MYILCDLWGFKWSPIEILGNPSMGTWSEHGPMSFELRTPIYVYRTGLQVKFKADSLYFMQFMVY